MRILFITTDEQKNLDTRGRQQGDCHENVALIGLRKLLGKDCVDYPRKNILYHDWSTVKKEEIHGQGFSIYDEPIEEIPEECRDLTNQTFDVILYGTSFNYGMVDLPEIEAKCKTKFYIDGNDLYGHATKGKYLNYRDEIIIGNQAKPAFKTQLIKPEGHLYPFGVAVPESKVMPIDLSRKKKIWQESAPKETYFEANSYTKNHIFSDETDYYNDIADAWFGLSCKRGGWDAIRNYEIIAAGSLLLFRDYYLKPPYASPVGLPTIGYSTKDQLNNIISSLVVNDEPTQEYVNILLSQRRWLLENATIEARAKYIIGVLESYV